MKTKQTKKTDHIVLTWNKLCGYWDDDSFKTECTARYWFAECEARGLKPKLFKRTTILEELKGR